MNAPQTLKKLSFWHETLIDFMVANPTMSQRQLAAHFKVTQAWLSLVINSDLFRERLAARREAAHDVVIRDTVAQVHALSALSIDTLTERVERLRDDPNSLPTAELRETVELALRAQGVLDSGKNGSAGNTINANEVNVLRVDAGILESAREKMRTLTKSEEVSLIDVEPETSRVLPASGSTKAGD